MARKMIGYLVCVCIAVTAAACGKSEPQTGPAPGPGAGNMLGGPAPQGAYLDISISSLSASRGEVRVAATLTPSGGLAPLPISQFNLRNALNASLQLATVDGDAVQVKLNGPGPFLDPPGPASDLVSIPAAGRQMAVEVWPSGTNVSVVVTRTSGGTAAPKRGENLYYSVDSSVDVGPAGGPTSVRLWGQGSLVYNPR